ncbi:probable cytochrome P450 12a5, mitochondrial [Drosophila innubila]|uniref:probable cytochrome P450 12a5, mitochondrial n=1 Tax=Drosophila innubila TaxID=198719 RepID=UPI00148C9853|nr:probable cytochrome P450 12a5, mitochondrial [Drosophila innubila]
MLGQHLRIRHLVQVSPIQQRIQTRAACAAFNGSQIEIANTSEWDQARPYNHIPKLGTAQFLFHMLPGGRYHKMEFPEIMLDLHRRHGSLYRLPGIMGKAEFLVSNDPAHFERVYRVEGPWPERQGKSILDYHRSHIRKDFYQGIEGILSTDGEMWSKFRSTVNPVMMQPKIVRLYYQKMSNVNKEFIQRIREIRDSNTFEVPNNFEEEINRWTLESVSVIALDKQLGLINKNRNNPEAKKLFDNINQFFVLAAKIELKPSFWRYLPSPLFNKALKALDTIQDVSVGYVNEALERLEREPTKKPEHEQSVLEKLLKIDKKVAIVMAMDMLVAGVDTTTSTLTGCLLCLAKNPEKQAKLREEILRILPHKDSEFTESSLNNMPYLRACIKESLRIYPLLSGNSRVTKSDIVLNGYQIPKETAVIMHYYVLHMDDQHFPRSKEFLPERWLRQTNEEARDSKCPSNSLKASNPFVYLPFGFGPRMCIGKRIVEMELELGIARLIRNFYIEFNHSTTKAFKSQFINVPNIPLKFKFTDVQN